MIVPAYAALQFHLRKAQCQFALSDAGALPSIGIFKIKITGELTYAEHETDREDG
jgi:hypothetical protein